MQAVQTPSNAVDPSGSNATPKEAPIVLMSVGLIGSGKSTFAEALVKLYPERFVRCSQDELGDRKKVEKLVQSTLREGLSAFVDRTNFNEDQRAHWINIARQFPGTEVWVLVFDTPYEVCAARLQTRKNHPTITSVELGLMVLSRFASDFREPDPREGYDRIIHLKPADQSLDYTKEQIDAILQRFRDAEPSKGLQSFLGFTSAPGTSGSRGSNRGGFRSRSRPAYPVRGAPRPINRSGRGSMRGTGNYRNSPSRTEHSTIGQVRVEERGSIAITTGAQSLEGSESSN